MENKRLVEQRLFFSSLRANFEFRNKRRERSLMFRELDGVDEQVPLLPVPRTVSNFISPSLHTRSAGRILSPFRPLFPPSPREISGSLTPENESFPGKYFFSFRLREIRKKKKRRGVSKGISLVADESSVNEGLIASLFQGYTVS